MNTISQTKPRRRTPSKARKPAQKAPFWLSRYRDSYKSMDEAMRLMRTQIMLMDALPYAEREHLLGALNFARSQFTHAWSRMEYERLCWYARKSRQAA